MKTSITKSSDKENVAKMSRPFDKLNTLYSRESWIRSSAACALDFLFKKIHHPNFFFYQRLSTRLTSQVKKDSICELCCILCRYPSSGRQSQKESGKLPGTAVQQVVFWGTLWKAYRHLPNEIIKKYIFRNNSTYLLVMAWSLSNSVKQRKTEYIRTLSNFNLQWIKPCTRII